jgi:iron complex outermembrane receptor protein
MTTAKRSFRIKVYLIVLLSSLLHMETFGQGNLTLEGIVIDEFNNPLAGAFVYLPKLNRGTETNSQGEFLFAQLRSDSVAVEISFQGYKTLRRTVYPGPNSIETFVLKRSTVKLDEVVVDHDYGENKKKENSLNVEVVNDEYLKQNLGGSLMKSLERLPGVSTIEIGSGQSKPVIRGLGFNRVLVLENNIKHESQQWGSDHGLEIDQYAVDQVEIIKGPASLMYGSDAIGGVIDMKNRDIPLPYTFGGSVDITGKTNNDFLGTSVSLFARKEHLYFTARATITDFGDYRVPTDLVEIYSYPVPLHENRLRNSAGKEQNLHASFGYVRDKFQSKFYISNVNTLGGFFANAHGLEPRNVNLEVHDASSRDILYPFHKVNHFKTINQTTFRGDEWKLEVDLGYQRNLREEWSQYTDHGYMPSVFPEELNFNPEIERHFQKDVFSGNANFHHKISDKMKLIHGVSAEHQDNQIGGRGFIIPAFRQLTAGGYSIAKYHLNNRSLIQAGIRYDIGNIQTSQHEDWFESPVYTEVDTTYVHVQRAAELNRNFSNFSWSVGYNYNADKWSFKANAGKSFRMPIAKELAANGVNYHRFSYEVGNSELSPEVSYQLDLGLEYSSERFAIGASPFINYFTNYIYLNPTARFNRLYGFGNQVFEYTEAEVLRYGGELHAHYEITKNIQFGFIGEYVYALQMSGAKKGFTLPFAPPATALFNLKYQRPQMKFVKNPYVSLDYRITAAQNNIVPPESTTEGFQIFHLRLGGDVMFRNQRVDISLQVQNLLNTKYFNHTSFYRLINVPEAGRNLIMNISIPFASTFKTNKN